MRKKKTSSSKNFFTLFIKKIIKFLKNRSERDKKIVEQIQLSIIYFFATLVLMFLIQSSLGYFPNFLYIIVPFSKEILATKFFAFFTSPEKIFVLYLIIIEIVINRPILRFSILVKFNILLIFILEMIQNLVLNWWDLLFSRELDLFQGDAYFSRNFFTSFLIVFFIFFYLLYLVSYFAAMRGRFPSYPGVLQKIIDSVAFWLQIRKIEPNQK